MIVKTHCPECKKPAKIVQEDHFRDTTSRLYDCGHRVNYRPMKVSDFATFISEDLKRPYQFQIEGAMFAIKSGVRVLIEDEMGLGKTIQALMTMWTMRKEFTRMGLKKRESRFLVVCKARLKVQWMREVLRWCGDDWNVHIVENEHEFIGNGVDVAVVSYDLLWRFKDIDGWIAKHGITCMICDEVQNIKNSEAKRTRSVQTIAAGLKYLIFLSGTPIKNHAGEFFPALNMLRPDKFPTRKGYEMGWVDTYWNGRSMQYGGIRNPEAFKEYTKEFIIRRTRKEVLPELPEVTRDFRFSELGSMVQGEYDKTEQEFVKYYMESAGEAAFVRQSNILGFLSKMRHLTGLAKIAPTVEEVEEFIMETDRKLVIFVHHKDVAETLVSMLEERRKQWPAEWGQSILYLPASAGQEVIDKFAQPENRIMVASTLSAGEGINLQFCSDFIMMERQWNPANEEQPETRFVRIGQLAEAVFGKYMVAVGTIDEYLSELVEKKRSFSASTLDGKKIKWDEASLLKELAEILAQKGALKWGW